jgi:hypothetical protein
MAGRFGVSQFKGKYAAAAGIAKLRFALRIGAFLDHLSSFRAVSYLLESMYSDGLAGSVTVVTANCAYSASSYETERC